MEGPKNIDRLPLLAHARVEGYNAAVHSVYVTLPSVQEIYLPVRVLINGPADASRVEQLPLPVVGTWGLVAFPYGTIESAVWLGAFYHSPVNAITTSSPPTDQDSQTKYMSHASGSYSILDYIGQYFYRAPDGTNFLINSSNQEPITYTHGVNASGVQILQRFYDQNRNQDRPQPFWTSFNHPSGSSFTISPSGDITILEGNITRSQIDISSGGTVLVQGGLPNLASIQITPPGVITMQTGSTQDGDNIGPIVVLDPQAGLITIQGENNKSSILMDPTGVITATADGGNSSILMNNDSSITITAADGLGVINMAEDGSVNIKSLATIVNIDAAIAVSIIGTVKIALSTVGDIGLTTTEHPLESINTMINIYNEHIHETPEGSTGPPIPQMP